MNKSPTVIKKNFFHYILKGERKAINNKHNKKREIEKKIKNP